MGRIDGQRRHQGKNFVPVLVAHGGPFAFRQPVIGGQVDIVIGQFPDQIEKHLAFKQVQVEDKIGTGVDLLLRR